MPRQSDVTPSVKAAITIDARSRRIITTATFVKKLAAHNHIWTFKHANSWIEEQQCDFKDVSTEDCERRTFMIRNLGEGLLMGFPSPVQDYVESRLDLNALIMLRPSATLFIPTVEGLVLVDKSVKPKEGDVIYFEAWGTFQIGRMGKHHIVCRDGETSEGEALEDVVNIGIVTFDVRRSTFCTCTRRAGRRFEGALRPSFLKLISPPLHHLPAFFKALLRVVTDAANVVAIDVC